MVNTVTTDQRPAMRRELALVLALGDPLEPTPRNSNSAEPRPRSMGPGRRPAIGSATRIGPLERALEDVLARRPTWPTRCGRPELEDLPGFMMLSGSRAALIERCAFRPVGPISRAKPVALQQAHAMLARRRCRQRQAQRHDGVEDLLALRQVRASERSITMTGWEVAVAGVADPWPPTRRAPRRCARMPSISSIRRVRGTRRRRP